jgi:hypothetical protein
MKQNQAPIMATWLLRRFGSSPNNESIIGDLTERYRDSRSHFWFWRQTLSAIGAGLWSEVTANKRLALRAVIVGWVSSWVLMLPLIEGYVAIFLKNETFSVYNPTNWWTISGSVIEYYDWWFVLLAPFAMSLPTGWLVGRTHPQLQRAMVLTFFASRCAFVLAIVCFFLIGMFLEPQYLSGFVKLASGNCLTLPGILAGGGLFSASPGSAPRRRTIPS